MNIDGEVSLINDESGVSNISGGDVIVENYFISIYGTYLW